MPFGKHKTPVVTGPADVVQVPGTGRAAGALR